MRFLVGVDLVARFSSHNFLPRWHVATDTDLRLSGGLPLVSHALSYRMYRPPPPRTNGQAVLAKRIASTAASVYASTYPLPSELNPILRPLVSAVKKEPDMQRRGRM